MTKLCNHQEQELSTCHLWLSLWCSKNVPLFIQLGQADRAHRRFISNTQLFTQKAAHTDTRVTVDDWLPESVGGQELNAPGRHDSICWGRKECCSFTSPQSDYFSEAVEKRECHDSALGCVHSLSCDDVTDGISTLISHNKRKSHA